MSHLLQGLVAATDETHNTMLITSPTGRLPRREVQELRRLLRGASVIKTVGPSRRGQLSLVLEGEWDPSRAEAVYALLAAYEKKVSRLQRAEANKSTTFGRRQARRQKGIVAVPASLIGDPYAVALLEGLPDEFVLGSAALAV